jgi:hypothetical protein
VTALWIRLDGCAHSSGEVSAAVVYAPADSSAEQGLFRSGEEPPQRRRPSADCQSWTADFLRKSSIERDELSTDRARGEGWRWQPGVKALYGRAGGGVGYDGGDAGGGVGVLHRFESSPALMIYLGCARANTPLGRRESRRDPKLATCAQDDERSAWNNSRAPRMSRTVLARQAGCQA